MDHSEVREILEDAAIAPAGLERLMAGDTPTASLVAGHLAGCPDCTDELERLRRSVGLIAPVVRDVPPPELRERTLAYVAALGRPRGGAEAAPTPPPQRAPAPAALPGRSSSVSAIPTWRERRLAPLLALAAAIVLAVGGTAVVTNASRDAEITHQAAEIEALGDVARWNLRLDKQADVRRVALSAEPAAGSAAATGQLTYSATSTELVVVADGLVPPPTGSEYKCWIEIDGTRSTIGKMFFGGDVAYWVGPAPEVATAGGGTRFGVSLVDLANPDAPGRPVLTGTG